MTHPSDDAPQWPHDTEIQLLRRERDHHFEFRLQRLEDRLEKLEDEVDKQLREMERSLSQLTTEIHELVKLQEQQGPALVAMNRLVQSGLVIRWLIAAGVGVIATAATLATAWEAMHRWFR
jgi:chromosome segregation ATPase